jgi:hypothetical protein
MNRTHARKVCVTEQDFRQLLRVVVQHVISLRRTRARALSALGVE